MHTGKTGIHSHSKSNISVIQRYQSKLLRITTNAPRYVTNQTLHSDLRIPYVHAAMKDYIHKHGTALESHPNPLVEPLTHTTHTGRLKRRWTFDEMKRGEVTGLTLDQRHNQHHISLQGTGTVFSDC